MMTPAETAERIAAVHARQKLAWYEDQIAKRTRALAEIMHDLANDKTQPWKYDFATFDEYCQNRFDMTSRRFYQIAAAGNIKTLLAQDAPEIAAHALNLNEGQARELGTVPREQRAAVLKAAIDADKKKLTAAKIREAKAKAIEAEPTCTCAAGSVGATQCPIHNPHEGGDEPCATSQDAMDAVNPSDSAIKPTAQITDAQAPPVASNAPIAVQPGDGAHTQIEFSFACQIVAPEDDAIWFQNLTPIERGQAIARARQQP